ncbi:MAG: hypothetical protein IK121_09875, partial [Lachnospiraceae bacterium]|nr:hypothetical protein [Lachnospiraceae bacterium]
GWYVNWAGFGKDVIVRALVIKGTVDIQGLIALKDEPERKAVHILWACTSPSNNSWLFGKKDYIGVGGHLFAIAGKYSLDLGYGGFVYGDASNQKIMRYYIENLYAEAFPHGENFHPYRIAIYEGTMQRIIKEYDYDELSETALDEI